MRYYSIGTLTIANNEKPSTSVDLRIGVLEAVVEPLGPTPPGGSDEADSPHQLPIPKTRIVLSAPWLVPALTRRYRCRGTTVRTVVLGSVTFAPRLES